jgi:hypothetical protein
MRNLTATARLTSRDCGARSITPLAGEPIASQREPEPLIVQQRNRVALDLTIDEE